MNSPDKKPRVMPKGGRKGGSVFPRVPLQDALGYARKLVTKTHVTSQPKDVVLSGIVGARSGRGEVRMAALKQYGLMKGDSKSGFTATDLAKRIAAAPGEELPDLLRQAALKPTVFKSLAETFHGDTISRAKLKQRAADLKVHPDETEACIDVYLSSMLTAALVKVDGDQVTHLLPTHQPTAQGEESAPEDGDLEDSDSQQTDNSQNESEQSDFQEGSIENGSPRPKAVFNVNVTLDSSMDIEKLQRQLELLKKFGAI